MPAVDGATAYVGWNDGITAFPAYCGTGGATCRPTWIGKVNDVAVRGPMSEVTYGANRLTTPVVSDGMVFATDYQQLYAFPTDCAPGGKTCEPSWYANPPGGIPGHTVAAAGDGLVVIGSGGDLYAYPTHCGGGAHLCRPTWVARGAGQATIWNGFVFASDAHHLYAYPADCQPRGRMCDPLWVGEVSDPTQCCQTAPAVANGLVYIGAGNRLYGFPTSCASGGARCAPTWTGATGERGAQIVSWAIDGDRAFATTSLGGDLYAPSGHIYAFRTRCDGSICRPAWSVEVGGTPYVTAHDGLLFASTFGGFIVAYPEACVSGAACDPVWSAATFDGGAPFSAPIVTDRGVYSGGNSGRVYVFTIPRKASG